MAPKRHTPRKKFSRHKRLKGKPQAGLLTKAPAKKPRSKRPPYSKRAVKAAGLPLPSSTKIGTAEFTALQKKWYDKLEASGFEDIEWVDHTTGRGQDSDYLRGSAAKGRVWSPERAQFYRLLQNYVTHYQFKTRRLDRYIMTRLNEGQTYRQILEGAKKKFKFKKSLYWLYYKIQDLVKDMVIWNKQHKLGLLNPANADSWADDMLLADFGNLVAPNGLRLDPGWLEDNASDWLDEQQH